MKIHQEICCLNILSRTFHFQSQYPCKVAPQMFSRRNRNQTSITCSSLHDEIKGFSMNVFSIVLSKDAELVKMMIRACFGTTTRIPSFVQRHIQNLRSFELRQRESRCSAIPSDLWQMSVFFPFVLFPSLSLRPCDTIFVSCGFCRLFSLQLRTMCAWTGSRSATDQFCRKMHASSPWPPLLIL